MITYWTFTGQFPVFFWFFGLLLFGFVGAFLFPIVLELPVDGPMWTVMAAIIVGDLLLGAVWLKGRSSNYSSGKITVLSLIVLVAAGGTAMAPVLSKQNTFSFKGMVNDMFGPPTAVDGQWFDRFMGDVTITEAEIAPSYIVPDRSAFLAAARSFDHGETAPAHELLAPHVKAAPELTAKVVNNEIQIHGIKDGYESVYVTVYTWIETDPEQIKLSCDRYTDSEYRVLPSDLLNVTGEDVKRGYLTLPLKSTNMTMTYFSFWDEWGPEDQMRAIANDVINRPERIEKFFDNGRMAQGL